MEIEKAIKTAIDYETRVRDVYREAAAVSKNEIGKRVFEKLAVEEQGHVDYLQAQLKNWQKTGKLSPEKLQTAIPSKGAIDDGVSKLKDKMKNPDLFGEVQMLGKALDVEIKTSDFYREMVSFLKDEPQRMFARFLEIEEGHLALVQAEIDSITGNGFWFDFREFSLETE